MIGSFGEIVFVVSTDISKTLNNLQRQGGVTYAEHAVISGKPVLELTGLNAETISFDMFLCSQLGVTPVDEVKQLREMRDQGVAEPLILDGEPQGADMWVITDISEKWEHLDPDGSPIIIQVTVNLKEYTEVD